MKYTWGELISLEYGKPVPDKDMLGGNVPVYGTNGQIGTSNLPPQCPCPSFILGRKGAYRGVHFSSKPFSVIDTAFFALSKTPDLDLKWAYYKFLTYDINRMDSGSAIPSTDRYEIYSMRIELPSLEEQRAVVSVLKKLDEKIALNRDINHHLAGSRSATESSPDIRRGKRVSRSSARLRLSIAFCRILSIIGAAISANSRTSSDFGMCNSYRPMASLETRCLPLLPFMLRIA